MNPGINPNEHHQKPRLSFFKRTRGKIVGGIVGPTVALVETHVLQFDLPILETMNTKQDESKLLTFLNAAMMTTILNPFIFYHNFTTYSKHAIEAGNDEGAGAVKDSFAWLLLPKSSLFKPTKEGLEHRCIATKIDMNIHHMN